MPSKTKFILRQDYGRLTLPYPPLPQQCVGLGFMGQLQKLSVVQRETMQIGARERDMQIGAAMQIGAQREAT